MYGFVTQFFDVCIVYIIEYTGNYCHLSKVSMCHWHHNDILRRTNLIHFYIDAFIKMQYEFLNINLIRLTSYIKIEFDFFSYFILVGPCQKSQLFIFDILRWLLLEIMCIESDKVRILCRYLPTKFRLKFWVISKKRLIILFSKVDLWSFTNKNTYFILSVKD